MARVRTPLVALVMVGFGVAAAASACSTGTTGTSGASSSSSTGGGGSSNAASSGGGSSGGGNSSATGSSSRANSSSRAASGGGSGFSFGSSGFMIPDGGFNVDAGFQPYTGTPEPGVVCGAAGTCDPATDGGLCCVGLISGMSACAPMCQQFDLPLRCDGPEDCTGGNVCCVVSGLPPVNECRPAAMCEGSGSLQEPLRICNTSADCPAGSGCCESATLRGLLPALMVGACVQGCNVQ